MSKKDYEKIAAVLKLATEQADHCVGTEVVEFIATHLTDVFEAENPNFRTDQFLSACGVL